jgi:hypothetical protein
MVADQHSTTTAVDIPKALFRTRNRSVTFDEDGFLTGLTAEDGSALAGALSAATGAAEGFTSGVEGGTKAFNAIQSARRATLDAELARVKTQLELRQQRLVDAGLDATEQDAVELQRLQQLQGILGAQSEIRKGDPSLVAELLARAPGDLAWYSAPPPADPPSPQEVIIHLDGAPEPAPDDGAAVPPPDPPSVPLGGSGSDRSRTR